MCTYIFLPPELPPPQPRAVLKGSAEVETPSVCWSKEMSHTGGVGILMHAKRVITPVGAIISRDDPHILYLAIADQNIAVWCGAV